MLGRLLDLSAPQLTVLVSTLLGATPGFRDRGKQS